MMERLLSISKERPKKDKEEMIKAIENYERYQKVSRRKKSQKKIVIKRNEV